MMLCDHAQVADGKLFISGGGWSVVGTPTPLSAIALLLRVPWTMANHETQFKLRLVAADGAAVTQPSFTDEPQPVEIAGTFEVGRPPGLAPGSLLDLPLAVRVPRLVLQPGRYVWELSVGNETHEDWQLSFQARSANQPNSAG